MREILFRGKRVDNSEWADGYYWENKLGNHFIRTTSNNEGFCLFDFEVIPETVGQFTGISDKHGKKIFEGDICKAYKKVQAYKDFEFKGVVQYSTEIGAFELVLTPFDSPMLCDYPDCEVIGNIHDNELSENSHD